MSADNVQAQSVAVHDFKGPVKAVLTRQIPVSVLDVSAGGGLLESQVPLLAGTVGKLRVSIEGTDYGDDARITRCVLLQGAGTMYRAGAEFVRSHPVVAGSLRLVVRQVTRRTATPRNVRGGRNPPAVNF